MLPAPIQPILRALVAFFAVIVPSVGICVAYVVEFAADDLLMRFCVGCCWLRDQPLFVIRIPRDGCIMFFSFWQQILRYHPRVVALDNSRLVKLAMVDGCTLSSSQSVTAATNKGWQHYVGSFLKQHSQQLFHSFDIAAVMDREQHWVTFKYFHDDSHCNLLLYRTLQPEYQYAHYLSEVKCFSNRRLLSRFRSGCHGLRVQQC